MVESSVRGLGATLARRGRDGPACNAPVGPDRDPHVERRRAQHVDRDVAQPTVVRVRIGGGLGTEVGVVSGEPGIEGASE